MNMIFESGLIWWITAIDLPVMSALFWMILKVRREAEDAADILRDTLEVRTSQLREGLAAFKLEVAKTYSSVTDMKDLEMRIVAHLLRIESKLDRTALKTEAMAAQKKD
ncbi:MAG: hypothetical protein DI626_01960 [Micavibrio aeruginosavorus]|uniref:Uncharacterized protein n=1 Tax=Micavibrio aeruginosavorus TaxID=349221 RepID=A0A2W5A180_9BACT|nr:MAG: hypothetical protein DI626_01960 [Micavibrio aeruginosavorus]